MGYAGGYYDGGEAIVERLLPGNAILPEFSLESVVAAGLERLSPHFHYLLGTDEVVRLIDTHLREKRPFSLIRLGDGELLTMAQDLVMDIEQVRKEGPFLPYAGVNVPNLQARDLLAQAVRGANVVGIPQSRRRTFQPLAIEVFRACGIDYRNLALTYSTINFSLCLESRLSKVLSGRRLLTIGNLAEQLAQALRVRGYEVADAITPVAGVEDVPRVMEEIAVREFDLALVSAGIAAVIIAYRIATEKGRAAIDFGHVANAIAKGEISLDSI